MTSVLSIRGFQNAADKSHKSRWSHKSHSCHRPKMSSTSTACCAVGHSASSVESLCEGGRTSTIELHQRIRQDLGGVPADPTCFAFFFGVGTLCGRGTVGAASGC